MKSVYQVAENRYVLWKFLYLDLFEFPSQESNLFKSPLNPAACHIRFQAPCSLEGRTK